MKRHLAVTTSGPRFDLLLPQAYLAALERARDYADCITDIRDGRVPPWSCRRKFDAAVAGQVPHGFAALLGTVLLVPIHTRVLTAIELILIARMEFHTDQTGLQLASSRLTGSEKYPNSAGAACHPDYD